MLHRFLKRYSRHSRYKQRQNRAFCRHEIFCPNFLYPSPQTWPLLLSKINTPMCYEILLTTNITKQYHNSKYYNLNVMESLGISENLVLTGVKLHDYRNNFFVVMIIWYSAPCILIDRSHQLFYTATNTRISSYLIV
jgi:hypothetical protein